LIVKKGKRKPLVPKERGCQYVQTGMRPKTVHAAEMQNNGEREQDKKMWIAGEIKSQPTTRGVGRTEGSKKKTDNRGC